MADRNEQRPRREKKIIGGTPPGCFVVVHGRCIRCGTCVTECRYNAIFVADDEYRINTEACFQCGVCAEICPAGAVIFLHEPVIT